MSMTTDRILPLSELLLGAAYADKELKDQERDEDLADVWVKESFRDMGWLSSRSEYVHLYLNGLYWGVYQPSEAIDASYFAATVWA